jgi:hypothetical protein
LDSRLRELQSLLGNILEDARGSAPTSPSHWELPILPPPDAEGRLSSTDLLNWWFRTPQSRTGWDAYFKPIDGDEPRSAPPPTASPVAKAEPVHDGWSELSVLFPEPEEHLADEHAQASVDCFYDFLHAVGQRDVDAASALIDDAFHTIDFGEEVDKLTFTNGLRAQIDELRDWDFEVSLAVAPEPISHPLGVLMHVIIQFDAVNRLDGSKRGRVERRLAILRQDDSGLWKIAGMPNVAR